MKSSGAVTCVIFDVNAMQEVNEQRGHEFANYVLEAIEAKLKSSFALSCVTRLAGDEWLVTHPTNGSSETNGKARQVAQTIRDALGIELSWGIGVGVTEGEAKRASAFDLFERKRTTASAARQRNS